MLRQRNGYGLTFPCISDHRNECIAIQPKPTGYLNVYEYNLSTMLPFEVTVGDTLNISWHTDVDHLRNICFSLAYYNGTSAAAGIPMVSIVVGNCDSEADLQTLNTLCCEGTLHSTGIITYKQTSTVINSTALLASTSINQLEPNTKLTTVSVSVVSIVMAFSLSLTVIASLITLLY